MTLESHHLWNIPETDDVVKLSSEVQFQEYTQRTVHINHTWMTNTSHSHIDKVLHLYFYKSKNIDKLVIKTSIALNLVKKEFFL